MDFAKLSNENLDRWALTRAAELIDDYVKRLISPRRARAIEALAQRLREEAKAMPETSQA